MLGAVLDTLDYVQDVITREINMGYDEPARRIYNLFGEAMFRVHPAKYPVIGHLQNFLQLTRDDLVTYYERMYVPDNIVFVAVGDLDGDGQKEILAATSGGLVVALDHQCRKAWAKRLASPPTVMKCERLADNQGPWVVTGCEDGSVIVLDGEGRLIATQVGNLMRKDLRDLVRPEP